MVWMLRGFPQAPYQKFTVYSQYQSHENQLHRLSSILNLTLKAIFAYVHRILVCVIMAHINC